MGVNGVCVGPVETLVLELVEIGVCVLVGVLVAGGDDARAGNVGEDDNVTSALI